MDFRSELLKFAHAILKDEIGEGHEEEIVDQYLASEKYPPMLVVATGVKVARPAPPGADGCVVETARGGEIETSDD